MGSVADEAARLVGLLGGYLGDLGGYLGDLSGDLGGDVSADIAAGVSEPEPEADADPTPGSDVPSGGGFPCGVCPICQGAALVRRVRPETIAKAADFAGFVAGALREWADWKRQAAASAGTARAPDATVGRDGKGDGAFGERRRFER